MRLFHLVIAGHALMSATAHAHPGHGVLPATRLFHYLAEPLHALPFLIIAGLLMIVVRSQRRSR